MKTLPLLIITILLLGSSIPVWGTVELDAYLPITGDPVTPEFKFDKTFQIDYPNGGKLKDALAGRSLTVTCFGNSTSNQSIKQLMDNINSKILSSKSPVSITNLDLSYMFSLRGTPTYAAMDYLLILRPTITGYLLNDGHQITPSTLDASWISFAISDPLVIDTKDCGNTEINHPLNTLKSILPDVNNVIYNTPGEEIFDQAFNQNLIDSTPLLRQPLDRWDSLFDPAYIITDTADPSSYKGEKVQATTFSTGMSGLGGQRVSSIDTDLTADTKYHLLVVDQTAGTINVQGYANQDRFLGGWAFITTLQPGAPVPLCCPLPWYDITWVWFAVAGVAITGFFIFYFRHFRK